MNIRRIYPVKLNLFDGEGAEGGAEAQGSTGELSFPDMPAKKGGEEKATNIVYGRQDAAPQTEQTDAGAAAQDTPESLRDEFKKLVSGRFKDVYTEETQRMIDRRFKEMKTMQAKLDASQPILDRLAQRYGIENGDAAKILTAYDNDLSLIEKQAEEAGMSVEQFRRFQQLERENKVYKAAQENEIENQRVREQAQRWYAESQQMKEQFPNFDLKTELSDRNFIAMLQAGVPMETAYKAKYFDSLLETGMQQAASDAQKKTVQNIRAKGARPAENGTASQGATFTVKNDPSKLTLEDFDNIAREVRNGKQISF